MELKANIRRSPYPSYRQTDIPWLGKIPAHWDVKRLKFLIAAPVTDGPHETPSFLPDGVPFLSVDSIQEGELEFDNCRFISPNDHMRFKQKVIAKRGDILLGKAASTGKIAQVKVDFEFSIWSPLALIRLNHSKADPNFIEYVLKSPELQTEIDFYCNSNTQKNISMQDIPILNCVLPPLREQKSIIVYLDRQTSKIDALIAKKQRLLELLTEQRSAVISQAVTKGLIIAVMMKNSGVAWLGNVPEHWEIMPLKRAVANRVGAIKTGPFGSQLLSSEMIEGEIKIYNQRSVIDKDIISGENYITQEKYKELKAFTTFPGDVLVTTRGTIGKCAILPVDAELGILHPCLLRIQPHKRKLLAEYLSLLIQDSSLLLTQLLLLSNATTIDVIYSDTIKKIIIPLPPLDEQKEIIRFVEQEATKINALFAKVEIAIERLREYRTALISSAVTGKIDVSKRG